MPVGFWNSKAVSIEMCVGQCTDVNIPPIDTLPARVCKGKVTAKFGYFRLGKAGGSDFYRNEWQKREVNLNLGVNGDKGVLRG